MPSLSGRHSSGTLPILSSEYTQPFTPSNENVALVGSRWNAPAYASMLRLSASESSWFSTRVRSTVVAYANIPVRQNPSRVKVTMMRVRSRRLPGGMRRGAATSGIGFRRGDAIADPVAGLDHRHAERLVDDRAQAMDVDAQGVGVRQFLAPDAGLEFLPRHHRRRCLHQRLQDLQRGRVELQQLALAAHFQRVEVEFQLAGVEDSRLRPTPATGQRIEAHVDFLQRERLDQV